MKMRNIFFNSQDDVNISDFYGEMPTAEETEDRLNHKFLEKKIGRNEMCPCGSEKNIKMPYVESK